jgi:hypothetical protein
MPRYSVKIGEIHLRSDKPITDEQRNFAVTALRGHELDMYDLADGSKVVGLVNVETVQLTRRQP